MLFHNSDSSSMLTVCQVPGPLISQGRVLNVPILITSTRVRTTHPGFNQQLQRVAHHHKSSAAQPCGTPPQALCGTTSVPDWLC